MSSALEAPPDAQRLAGRGALLFERCRFDEAEDACRDAIALDPACADAWLHLGCVLVDTRRTRDAMEAFGTAIRLRPDHAPSWSNFGLALRAAGEAEDALLALRRAASLAPSHPEIMSNFGQCLLALGRYREGFAAFEWRLLTAAKRPSHECWPVPHWRGEDFAGRTLLLHEEDGFGDTLQFVRFADAAKARGGRVVLLVREALASLLSRLPAVDAVYRTEAVASGTMRVPPPDLRCSLMSLPALLGTTEHDVPSATGYLAAKPEAVSAWRSRLGGTPGGTGTRPFHVGLVWAGGAHPLIRNAALIDRRRSLSLPMLDPLASAGPGLRFHSLQVGPAAAEARSAAGRLRPVDHADRIGSFDDTAALIGALDLLISVDTASAHLAGALGRPVWMLSRPDMCWRWRDGGTGLPWYRSMRTYRADEDGGWPALIARVAADLASARERGRF